MSEGASRAEAMPSRATEAGIPHMSAAGPVLRDDDAALANDRPPACGAVPPDAGKNDAKRARAIAARHAREHVVSGWPRESVGVS